MERYLVACGNRKRKAMALYKMNIRLSQEVYQYKQTGQILLKVFVNKPKSSPEMQYNNKFFFEELQYINTLRNRIAHQEPICFSHVTKEIDLTYIRKQYRRIMMLFGYMGIDGARLLKGLDDFGTVCKGIERLENI